MLSKATPPAAKIKSKTSAAILISSAAFLCIGFLAFPNIIRKIGIAPKGSIIAKSVTIVLIASTTIIYYFNWSL